MAKESPPFYRRRSPFDFFLIRNWILKLWILLSAELYRGQEGFVNLDCAGQRKIEGKRSERVIPLLNIKAAETREGPGEPSHSGFWHA